MQASVGVAHLVGGHGEVTIAGDGAGLEPAHHTAIVSGGNGTVTSARESQLLPATASHSQPGTRTPWPVTLQPEPDHRADHRADHNSTSQ